MGSTFRVDAGRVAGAHSVDAASPREVRSTRRSVPGGPAWSRRGASSRRAGAPATRGSVWSAGACAAVVRRRGAARRPAGRGPRAGCRAGPGARWRDTVSTPSTSRPREPVQDARADPVGHGARPGEVDRQLDPRVGGVDALPTRAGRPREPLGQLPGRDRPSRRRPRARQPSASGRVRVQASRSSASVDVELARRRRARRRR